MSRIQKKQAQEDGSLQEFSFVSDESPPAQLRYQGLRFQITLVYAVQFLPRNEWEHCRFDNELPIKVHKRICDVVNCPGKTGDVVLNVLEKQWARMGLSKHDCVSGTGDGGGENEGTSGVHSQLEQVRHDYVRRRCLGHLPWRVADQALHALGELHTKTKAISQFLHEGGTWNRFKTLAVTSQNDGGLGLFADGSPQYAHVFGTGTPRNIDERPDTTCSLLEFLNCRHQVLEQVTRLDIATRILQGKTNQIARESLISATDFVSRRVAFVLLKKALFVYYYIEGKEHVAMHTSMKDLFDRAGNIISNTRLDEYVLKFLGHSMAEVRASGLNSEMHWAEIAVRMSPGVADSEKNALVGPMIYLVDTVVFRMQAHLSLTAHNILRTTWSAARILSTNPTEAQQAAKELLFDYKRGLMILRSDQMTTFEKALTTNTPVFKQLQDFARLDQPVRLWQGGGKYADVFTFLANRFCGAPDHVLDAESVHAQWQYLTSGRRGIKLKMLNAILKLRHHYFTHGGLPRHEELEQWLEEICQARRARYRALVADGALAPNFVLDHPFRERFNLRATDAAIIHAVDHNDDDAADKSNADQNVETSFANYVRFLFQPHNLYCFTALPGPRKYVFITENKSIPYRDKARLDQASGRHLNVVWYETTSEIDIDEELLQAEELIKPCCGDGHSLPVEEMTIAEMCVTAGYDIPPEDMTPDFADRDAEKMHERRALNHCIHHFESRRLLSRGWSRIVNTASGIDIEQHVFQMRPVDDMTKMALARALQTRDGFTDDVRKRVWQLSWATLKDALDDTPSGSTALAKAVAGPKPRAKAKVARVPKAKPKAGG